ncbi:LITAF-like zinc ribbon domain-containing protein [Phlyctochytrium arcticum]|nr:LITAF-like zinc ribbon domain-containing protein [Phlyctochytrium arcticum]
MGKKDTTDTAKGGVAPGSAPPAYWSSQAQSSSSTPQQDASAFPSPGPAGPAGPVTTYYAPFQPQAYPNGYQMPQPFQPPTSNQQEHFKPPNHPPPPPNGYTSPAAPPFPNAVYIPQQQQMGPPMHYQQLPPGAMPQMTIGTSAVTYLAPNGGMMVPNGAPGTIYVVQQRPLQALGHGPSNVICSHCQQFVQTRTSSEPGSLTWLTVGGLCLIGCWLGCCLIPLSMKELKDTKHYCPSCSGYVGQVTRM